MFSCTSVTSLQSTLCTQLISVLSCKPETWFLYHSRGLQKPELPRSSLELEVVLLRHLAGRPKALIPALRSHEWRYTRAFTSFTDRHASLLESWSVGLFEMNCSFLVKWRDQAAASAGSDKKLQSSQTVSSSFQRIYRKSQKYLHPVRSDPDLIKCYQINLLKLSWSITNIVLMLICMIEYKLLKWPIINNQNNIYSVISNIRLLNYFT